MIKKLRLKHQRLNKSPEDTSSTINWELVEKINEVIDIVNTLSKNSKNTIEALDSLSRTTRNLAVEVKKLKK